MNLWIIPEALLTAPAMVVFLQWTRAVFVCSASWR